MWKIIDQIRDALRPGPLKPTGIPEVDRVMRSIGRGLEELHGIPHSMRDRRYQERGRPASVGDYFRETLGAAPRAEYTTVLDRVRLDSGPGLMCQQFVDNAAQDLASAPFPRQIRIDDQRQEYEYTYEEFINSTAWHCVSWLRPAE
jgi:hypothetical protein